MDLQYLVFFGAAISIVGAASYIKETLKGNTKPNRVSWFLWAIAPLISAFAAVSDGVKWAVLPVFMCGFLSLSVFIASFVNKNAYWKLGKFDYYCGVLSLLALILWAITKNPSVAILLAIISDGLAAIPTLIKSRRYPETENVSPYATGLFSALLSFMAMKTWSFSEVAFPFYLVIIDSCLVFFITRKKIKNQACRQ